MDDKLAKFILGVDTEIINEKVVIAPCWFPDSVGMKADSVSDGSCKIWNCEVRNSVFTYIVSGVGAAACLDVVTALGNTKCKDILFIGSAGALIEGVAIGDIVIPENIVCAEGASRFVNKCISSDCYGKKYAVDKALYQRMINFLLNNVMLGEKKLHTGDGISVESIALQFDHISEFITKDCKFIDMESSAFLAACNKVNIKGLIAYCISDNVAIGEPLYLLTEEITLYRKKVRKNIFPRIIEYYVVGENDGT